MAVGRQTNIGQRRGEAIQQFHQHIPQPGGAFGQRVFPRFLQPRYLSAHRFVRADGLQIAVYRPGEPAAGGFFGAAQIGLQPFQRGGDFLPPGVEFG